MYSEKDYITGRFGKKHMNEPNYDISFIKCTSKISERSFYMADHAFMGETYQGALQDYFNSSRNKYRFYDGQTR